MTIYTTKEFVNMYAFNKLYFSNHKEYCIYLWLFFNHQLHYKNTTYSNHKNKKPKQLYQPYINYPFFHETENILDVVFSITNNFPIINTKKLIDECFDIRNIFLIQPSLSYLTEHTYNVIKRYNRKKKDTLLASSNSNITDTKYIQQKTTTIYKLLYEDGYTSEYYYNYNKDENIIKYDTIYDEYIKYIEYINKIKTTIEKIAINKILRSPIYNYGLGLKLSIKNCGIKLTD